MRNLSLTEDTRPTELLRLVAGGDDEAVLSHICAMPAAQRARLEVACEVRPGDVIAYATPLFHSSFNGGALRPVFQTMFWAESPTHELRVARRKEARTIRRKPPLLSLASGLHSSQDASAIVADRQPLQHVQLPGQHALPLLPS